MLMTLSAEHRGALLSAIAKREGVPERELQKALSATGLLAKIGRELLGVEKDELRDKLRNRRRGRRRNDSRHLDVYIFAQRELAQRPDASRRSIAEKWLGARGDRVDAHSIDAADKLLKSANTLLGGGVFD